MYDAAQIKTELIGLVGWRQNPDSDGWQLTDMTTSSTGLWFNSIHPLLSIDNLISICPEFDRIHSDQSAINTAFTEWLKEKTEDAIVQAIEAWIDEKFEKKTASNLLERDKLFSVTGNFDDLELSSGKVVGIEVVPARSRSLLTEVTQIGVQFNTNQIIGVHLFKSGQKAPVQTQLVDYQGDGSVQWVNVSWKLDGEGAYFIGYDQRTVTGNAINGVRDYTWDRRGLTSYPTGRYFKATAFTADVADINNLWDLKENAYSVSTNYGLNLCLNARCDYTSFIIDQKNLFKSVIAYQVGINLLRELAFNPESRVNRNEANVERSQILYEIDGDTQGRNDSTLHGRYKKALKSVSFDDSGIDKICLPCRRRSIRFGSIGPGR